VSSDGGAAGRPPPRVCFFGTYRRDHTDTQLLVQACEAAGIEVVECHRALWEKTPHKDATYFGLRSAIALSWRYIGAVITLARERRRLENVSVYLIGFGGQLDCLWLAILLRRRRPIVYAPLVTLTETLVEDRGVFPRGSVRARLAAWLDRASLRAAERVVIDTQEHRRYLAATFAIAPERISTWYLGSDPGIFRCTPLPPPRRPLRVLFYSSFLPLHGVSVVLQAAALLGDKSDVEFALLGDGPGHAAAMKSAADARLTQVRFEGWVPYSDIPAAIADADICLGVFGASVKASMVIPNKVYEAAAVGRPIITADTPAIREVFAHGESAWLCPPADPAALATAIERLAADPALRRRLASGAAALMQDRFAPAAQGEKLAAIFAAAKAGG